MLLLETSQDANCPIKSIPDFVEIRMLTLAFRRMRLPMLAMVLRHSLGQVAKPSGRFKPDRPFLA
jgi:hypothetical protein